ncbi:hypothetical protein [Aquisalinus flavus]|uniref:L,D-transpeptidase scaffold domain-containing protein n=1 Tax=Aquisalinus flavus TaxID=1526572 RepID=A0A8J2V2U1_9PROT|nr:hypothetical protein [Aquisalinus flavus]MBD0425626.1 hypothetical protein [Aquisalinus flavus]UNE48756.1 hypothetical protein FF099_12195 [Aquisalinus flavus]GGD14528.1 hypothetical protein GCM10011342_24160 [Aquisalinus flavus]
MTRLIAFIVLFTTLGLAPGLSPAAAAPSPLVMERLLGHPDAGNRTYMGERFQELDDLRVFYANRAYAPVWTRETLLELRYAFMEAQRAGLSVTDYHFTALGTEYSNDNEMALELLATDAWLSLAGDLYGSDDADMLAYLHHALEQDRLYEALAELAAFRSGR